MRPVPASVPLLLALLLLSACGAVGGAASLVGTAVDVTASAVTTTVDVVTSPIR
ncbi:hypothetical protein HL658_35390 [Azospirillum sp. RWY-5-1]|uniref:Lipoprotein n=1 Tax=Azospirillum oleiclasticum TaxID=2735135 RepID=A0ABX2TL28_9PROT|nr:hypothetical protein [Azospirillum oleiclasticum]NYZ17856.1 hypothetical protein [Azospirillum oleiclasticum]NYZ25064.1 hypothetical protein [Azospirillum oleiclasticum]